MAQIKIYGLESELNPVKRQLSDAIHECVVEVLALPVEKRFHRFISLAREDFIFPADRSDRYLIIEVSLFEGRSIETKKQLIRRFFQTIQQRCGIEPQDVEITLTETPRHNWGIRGLPGDELQLNYRVEP